MRILAIESTCDETAAAVVESYKEGVVVLSSVVASSAKLQEKYGGVVPEVAAREQVKSIIPVITEALNNININTVEAVAVSFGPGLMGSLLIGVETGKVLSWVYKKKLLKVNHVSAHLMANWILDNSSQMSDLRRKVPEMPAIGLVASGGHTDFVYMRDINNWEWIGGTRDDAAGEAFDKAARAFGLPYPGGPAIDKKTREVSDDDYKKLLKKDRLPRPLVGESTLDTSFSGLKAAVTRISSQLSDFRSQDMINLYIRDFSEAVCDVLVAKVELAMDRYEVKSVLFSGGVAANSKIREAMRRTVEKRSIKYFVPELKYCGDNAAMIGASAILNPQEVGFSESPDPNMSVV